MSPPSPAGCNGARHPDRRPRRSGRALRTLAGKIDHLLNTVLRADDKPYTLLPVEQAVRRDSGVSLSAPLLHQLRPGASDNPTFERIQALARFRGATGVFIFDDEIDAKVDAEVELPCRLA